MIKKIERPDWSSLEYDLNWQDSSGNGCIITAKQRLDKWFDEHIEPLNKLIDEGVEVYSMGGDDSLWWSTTRKGNEYAHKALLIGIQPIKKETREDKLADLVMSLVRDMESGDEPGANSEWYAEAKRALEGE